MRMLQAYHANMNLIATNEFLKLLVDFLTIKEFFDRLSHYRL